MNVCARLLSILCVLIANTTNADVLVFTDQEEWEAAVGNAYLTETFDSLPNTSFQPGLNAAGLIDVEITSEPLLNGIDDGVATGFHLNGTRFLVINQGFEDDTAAVFRLRDPTNAFAADWINTTTAANLRVVIAGQSISFADHLEGAGDGFLGFLSDTAFSQVIFGVDGMPPGGEGFALDNLSIAMPVPEPPALTLLLLALLGTVRKGLAVR